LQRKTKRNHVWPIEWHEYQRARVSLKVTFVVTSDKARRAVPLHLERASCLFPFYSDEKRFPIRRRDGGRVFVCKQCPVTQAHHSCMGHVTL